MAETDATTHGMKWALHLAIAAAADVTVLDTLLSLAGDRRNGRNRALLVDALARIDDPRARAALADLASDPDLANDVRRVSPGAGAHLRQGARHHALLGWYANRPRGMRGKAEALLRQIFEVDPLACPSCQGPMRIVAGITQASVVDRILTHLRARASTAAPGSPVGADGHSPPAPAPP